MSTVVNIEPNQSLLDIAIQENGNLADIANISKANNVSVTDTLIAGDTLDIPSTITRAIDIAVFYTKNELLPATGIREDEISLDGIGIMIIEDTFIVR